MSHPLPHLHEARNPDGSVDHDKVDAGMTAWMKAIKEGQFTITDLNQWDLADGSTVLQIVRKARPH